MGASACKKCTCADVTNAGPDCKQEELTTGGAGMGKASTDCKSKCYNITDPDVNTQGNSSSKC